MHPGEAVPLIGAARRCRTPSSRCRPKVSAASPSPTRDGKLAGVITDGDLRRHMRVDLLQAPVEAVMTVAPKTVRPDQLASEALALLNSSKITALIVVDQERPVGILHFHDLCAPAWREAGDRV